LKVLASRSSPSRITACQLPLASLRTDPVPLVLRVIVVFQTVRVQTPIPPDLVAMPLKPPPALIASAAEMPGARPSHLQE